MHWATRGRGWRPRPSPQPLARQHSGMWGSAPPHSPPPPRPVSCLETTHLTRWLPISADFPKLPACPPHGYLTVTPQSSSVQNGTPRSPRPAAHSSDCPARPKVSNCLLKIRPEPEPHCCPLVAPTLSTGPRGQEWLSAQHPSQKPGPPKLPTPASLLCSSSWPGALQTQLPAQQDPHQAHPLPCPPAPLLARPPLVGPQAPPTPTASCAHSRSQSSCDNRHALFQAVHVWLVRV